MKWANIQKAPGPEPGPKEARNKYWPLSFLWERVTTRRSVWPKLPFRNSWEVPQPAPKLKCTCICWIIDSKGNTQLVTCYAWAAGKCHPSSERDIEYFTLPAAQNKAAWGVSITSASDLLGKGENCYKTRTVECKILCTQNVSQSISLQNE